MERSEGWAVPSNCTCHFSDQFYPDVSLWIPWPKYQPTDGSNHSEAQKPCCSRPRRSLVWCQEPGPGLSPIQDGPCQAQIQQQKFQQVQEKGFQKLVIVQKLIVIYILSMHFFLFSIYASLGFLYFAPFHCKLQQFCLCRGQCIDIFHANLRIWFRMYRIVLFV